MGQYLDNLISTKNSESNYYYLIARQQGNNTWYLFDVDDDQPTLHVMWTKSVSAAMKFPTEEAVEDFKAAYVTSTASIVRKEK